MEEYIVIVEASDKCQSEVIMAVAASIEEAAHKADILRENGYAGVTIRKRR